MVAKNSRANFEYYKSRGNSRETKKNRFMSGQEARMICGLPSVMFTQFHNNHCAQAQVDNETFFYKTLIKLSATTLSTISIILLVHLILVSFHALRNNMLYACRKTIIQQLISN